MYFTYAIIFIAAIDSKKNIEREFFGANKTDTEITIYLSDL